MNHTPPSTMPNNMKELGSGSIPTGTLRMVNGQRTRDPVIGLRLVRDRLDASGGKFRLDIAIQ